MTMARIIVDIMRDSDSGTLKVKWYRDGYARGCYSVKPALIEEHSRNVRAALQELVEAGREGRAADYPALTRNVAEKGYGLYTALFFGANQSDRDNVKRVLEHVITKLTPHQDTITFIVPPRVHIPWGLIYDDCIAPQALVEPSNFWCMKYAVGTHYFDIVAEGIDTAWPPSTFTLLFGAHEDVWNMACDQLDPGERASLFDLLHHPEQPRFLLDDLITVWQTRKDSEPYGLLNFYCHADGSALLIGQKSLSASMFEQQFAREDMSDKPPTLVFLAGCQTAIGDLDTGFLEATSGPGYCGFIGTEVKVPDVFTLKFLASFLNRFYTSDKPVGDVLQELRKEYWPLSLVFSMCCARDLRLSPLVQQSG